jgi:hypothetical protein
MKYINVGRMHSAHAPSKSITLKTTRCPSSLQSMVNDGALVIEHKNKILNTNDRNQNSAAVSPWILNILVHQFPKFPESLLGCQPLLHASI